MTVALDHTIVPATDERASAEFLGGILDLSPAPGGINHHDGGRGVYFDDPDNHLMEIITKTYGRRPEGRPRD